MAGTEKALAAFKALVEGKTDKQMLLCYGGVGNGKTHLCEAAAIALYKRGLFCRVLTMARIMRALKECMGPEPPHSYEELLSNYCCAKWLILDDVGMGGSGSEWEYGQLEEIIVFRYRERLFTIMTTNRDLTELPERIVSRFRDPDIGTVVLNEGADYRRLKGG
jgi:DNA replication protein DnaC